jgi:hypothetical protein
VLLSCPGWLLAPPGSARRSVQSASSGRTPSPRSALPGRQPWRRWAVRIQHAVSTHPGSSSGVRRSGRLVSSPSGVRSPGVVVRGPAVRPSSVHPSSVHCLASTRPASTRPASNRLVSSPSGVQPVRCPPPSVRTRPSPPTYGGGVRDQVEAARRPSPQERVEVPVAAAPSGGSVDSPGGLEAGDAAEVAVVSRGRWADPGRVGCGRRPRVTAERPGRPGRRAERPWLAAALWAREEAAARGGCTCRVAADPC